MQNALKIALNFLKFRPRSVFEIEEKLKSKSVSPSEINKVIRVLKQNKLLDDAEFAKMWVRDRNLLKPEGSYLLKLELRKFGVGKNIIDDVLAGQDEEKLAKEALASKGRLHHADFQKKATFLQRRGFGMGVIYKILKE